MRKVIKKLDTAYMTFWDWATSTKGACYLLSVLIWGAVLIDPPKTLKDWLLIIVTVYYQGVALSAIGNQTKSEASGTRQLLQDTHDIVMSALKEIKDTHAQETEEIAELKEIITLLKSQNTKEE